MTTTVQASQTGTLNVPLSLIDVGENVRELDQAHVDALAGSIALRGLIVPLPVRPIGPRFRLIAGHHRHAACLQNGMQEVPVTLREQDGTAADSAAENVVRKQLSPLEEARAVQHMLDEGYTLDGAASVLGWSRALVSARAKILGLPEMAQRLLGTGALPVSTVETLLQIAAVSRELCEAALTPIADGDLDSAVFVRDPGRMIGEALRRGKSKVFAAYLSAVSSYQITELRLGKKPQAAYQEAVELQKRLDRTVYSSLTIRFGEVEVDQARAAGVLIELERCAPIITDRAVYRELVKQAVVRVRDELRAAKRASDAEAAKRSADGSAQQTPQQRLDAEHRASMRELTRRAHLVNLDLGSGLLQKLSAVDADDIELARFFVYGLLGTNSRYGSKRDRVIETLAATGIRLVFNEHRKTETPLLKSGKRGKTKVTYSEIQDAERWLWKFIDRANTAGELYGRALVVYAAQHYAQALVLPKSQRHGSVLPRSHQEIARKAFERLTKTALPGTHVQLQRAIEQEIRSYDERGRKLAASARKQPAVAGEPICDQPTVES